MGGEAVFWLWFLGDDWRGVPVFFLLVCQAGDIGNTVEHYKIALYRGLLHLQWSSTFQSLPALLPVCILEAVRWASGPVGARNLFPGTANISFSLCQCTVHL